MKRIFTAIFLICTLLAFTGCGGGGMKSKAGHLNLALWWFGETLDPAHAWDGWTLTRIGAGETLVAVNEHMEFVPQLADKWENVNPTTWRFHIRPNVKFQDGTPMTPELVKASLERTMRGKQRHRDGSAQRLLDLGAFRPALHHRQHAGGHVEGRLHPRSHRTLYHHGMEERLRDSDEAQRALLGRQARA